MNLVRMAKAALVLAAVALVPCRSYAWGIDYSDTYLSIRGLYADKQPGNRGNDQFIAGNIAYANGWTYGSNFVSLDFEDIGAKTDPANCVFCSKADSNSFELYSVFRTTLSGNKISGTKFFSFGPIRDVGWEFGLDIDTQNDQFASYKKLLITGPQFSIALPQGFWNITVGISHEWDTNAYLANGNGTNFAPTWEIETAWSYPFAAGPVPLNFTGFANFIGPKGKGATGDFYHRAEILLHPKLRVDIGDMLGYAPKKIEAGVGYEYWHNKFGSVPQHVPGTQQDAFFVEVGYHF
jgi:nucleoside-specific outer membrane channel protein Tsx